MSNLTEALNRIFNWLQQNQWIRFKETENFFKETENFASSDAYYLGDIGNERWVAHRFYPMT